jgi:NAD(P)-dependent dehydrogenase (short-subunit alcohol dehydrogenase family)
VGRLGGKAAIVTGSGGGIGRATALAFAREGADVAVADIQGANAEKVAAEVRSLGRPALGLAVDVTQRPQVERMVRETVAAFGKLDILVNNAMRLMPGRLEELSDEAWDTVVAIGLKGYFLCGQVAGREMIKRRSGVIINIASIGGLRPYPLTGAYSPVKAAQIMLAKCFAMEWAQHGIRGVAISPGQVWTPMTDALYSDPAILQGRSEIVPLKRIASPEEIAAAAVFLASDEARYVTAANLVVDGGHIESKFTHVPGRRWSGVRLE